VTKEVKMMLETDGNGMMKKNVGQAVVTKLAQQLPETC
jgi:hypothetical protein